MAALQKRKNSYRVLFRFRGKQHSVTIGNITEREAENWVSQVDQILLRIDQGLLNLPNKVDIVTFVKNGGKIPDVPTVVEEGRKPLKLSELCSQYLETHAQGVEENTLKTARIHLNHFERSLGESFPVAELTLAELQRHVNTRARTKHRGKELSPVTLKKEVASLRAVWIWATHMKFVSGAFPSRGLVYPKGKEKPPFMTFSEIERKAEGISKEEAAELWHSLFLTTDEITQFLAHVEEAAIQPWIYPAIVFAAHTGARRSEIIRVQMQDLDEGYVTIREKKRSKAKVTTRRVPLSDFLQEVIKDWLAVHPGGQYLFCHTETVERSKKRSRTTGHRNASNRPSSEMERRKTVKPREAQPLIGLTKDEAHDHFQRAIRGSKWEVMKGWHVLRHSFISNCAAAGVDQRIIDGWVGHQTEEMRKRYRHLIPSTEQDAMKMVFG